MKSENSISREYARLMRRKWLFMLLAAVLLIIALVAATFMGYTDLSVKNLLATLSPEWGDARGVAALTKTQQVILLELRLPRVLTAVIVGAALGVCGTVMQSTTGNIMASPFTTGISSAAGLGAAIGILFHPFGTSDTSVILCAFTMGMLNAAVVYGVTAVTSLGPGGMILVGVALNFLFSSANSLLQYVASEDQLSQIVHWSFGSFTGVTWPQIAVMAAALVLGYLLFRHYAWSFNIMSSGGDETAKALGVNATRVRVVSGICVTVVAAVTISFVGVIGFVGIVAPHVARIVIGSEHKILLPGSLLIGGLLVLVADTIGRLIVAPTIIPVGVVLSVVGAPIFLYLILTQRRRKLY